MSITIPNFTTSAVINGNTLISQADEQLNILMTDVENYVESTYQTVATNLEGTVGIHVTTASNFATQAEDSATNAALLYDMLTDIYLGVKASDPTLDNDGNALQSGALYFNSVSTSLKVYNDSTWDTINTVDAYSKTEVQTILPRVGFDTTNVTSPSVGQVAWNINENTLDVGLNGASLLLGQDQLIRVTNNSGVAIDNGTAVMATGTLGNSGRITVAKANLTQTNAKYILGIVTETIVNGADGFVTAFGKVRGIQTNGANYGEAWVDGDVLYVKDSGNGALTKVVPTNTQVKLPIAIVVSSHVTNGTLFVRVNSIDENHAKAELALKANINSPTLVTPNIGVATGTSFNSITGLASVAPLVAGTAAVGTSTLTARQDHVHPVQTSVSGNAGTATTLATSRLINGVGFNGSANITIPVNTTQKSDSVSYNIPFVSNITAGNQNLYTDSVASLTYNPSTNTLSATNFSGTLSGNASTSTTATTLATARNITLSGDVTGTASFNGSADALITATVADNSHNHTITNVTGLQAALDAKVEVTGNQDIDGIKTFIKSPIVPTPTAGTQVANKEYVDSQIRKTIFTGVYGLDWNETTDTYTRTGSDNYLAIQSLIRRCVLNADGTVNYYLHPDDSNFKEDGTPSVLTGADGNVMVEVPKFYYKYEYVTSNGNIIHRHNISLTPKVGYEVYWSHMHPTEKAYRYYPAYQGYNSGGVLKSISGVYPTTNQSIATFRSQAIANGSGWHQIDFSLYEALTLLCIIEYGTMNIQGALGQGRTMLSGGSWTGGSLRGITGLSNSLGNKSGNYTFAGSADAPEADLSFMSYRGCENFFGNVWRFADGINATGANSKTIYVNNNPATYASDVFTGDYYSTGVVTAGTGGFARKLGNSNKGFFPTDVTGGASNIGTTDYYYTSATVNTIALVGGAASDALIAGPLNLHVLHASSLVHVLVGSGVAR